MAGVDHFAVDHVLYKGRIISVVFDRDGGQYYGGGYKAGLTVLVDGKQAAHRPDIGRLHVSLL